MPLDITSPAQILGLISFAFGIASFYQKDDFKLKLLMLMMLVIHGFHFFLLDAITSALICGVSILRTLFAMYSSSAKFALGFIGVYLIAGLSTSSSLLELTPMFAGIIGTYALICLKGIALRIGLMLGASIWLINNIAVGSIGGVLLEAVLVAVNISTIYRLYKDNSIAKEVALKAS
ncbi:YgjV family protein [Catenovulum maritimum]|uniref:Uncharacterized protein n=1 Tax=Catenovulum maritimum TaxID=1513271 RepID=A0A0J8GX14_9ALTE|nr:YgjV family protein [Catenovulum maritimum]KMT65809.1 hypothetical protein XM47_07370 [Catenovulum maritimum]